MLKQKLTPKRIGGAHYFHVWLETQEAANQPTNQPDFQNLFEAGQRLSRRTTSGAQITIARRSYETAACRWEIVPCWLESTIMNSNTLQNGTNAQFGINRMI